MVVTGELYQAVVAACAAGKLIRDAWSVRDSSKGDDGQFTLKSSSTDLVTETDKACEAALVASLKAQFPTHLFIGEEGHGSPTELTDQPTWVLDPIDGTTNFVHRNASCAVLLALVINQKTELAVTLDPIAIEVFFAVRGKGAFTARHQSLDDIVQSFHAVIGTDGIPAKARKMHSSGTKQVNQALLCVDMGYSRKPDDVELFLEQYRQLAVVGNVRGVRTIGSCGLDLAYIADGRTDGCFHWHGPYIWDWAGGSLLVEEAGGFVGNPREGEEFCLTGRTVLAAATAELAQQMKGYLNVASKNKRLRLIQQQQSDDVAETAN